MTSIWVFYLIVTEKIQEGELVRKATMALYSVTSTSRKYDLPVDIQIDLFKTMVVAVNYRINKNTCNENLAKLDSI